MTLNTTEIKIFYSWQSDLPAKDTRNLIQDSIKSAVRLLRDTVEIDADRDTKGEYGSPDIVQTIFSKIDDCDIFIADVSAVCEYHPLDKDGNPKEEIKLASNPNVLLELGYAAHVIGWENIICIVNTDYGEPNDLPFDISHRRLTTYSLKSMKKEEVKRYIREIIQVTVENILENGKRIRPQFSNIKVGSYVLDAKDVSQTLVPLNLKEVDFVVTIKQHMLEECNVLIKEIEGMRLISSSQDESNMERNDVVLDQNSEPLENGLVLVKPKLQLELFKLRKVEISEDDRSQIKDLLREYLEYEIENPQEFFNLGNLKKRNTIDLYASYELEGTQEEEKKYDKIGRLEHNLYYLDLLVHYLGTFDEYLFFPLAILNNSVVGDEDITISLKINTETAEIIVPSESLFNPEIEGTEGIVYERNILKSVLMMPESSDIKYDTDISFAVHDIQVGLESINYIGGINGMPQYDSEDYVRELSKYIVSPVEGSISEVFYKINSLYAKEKKWLGAALLIRPMSENIEIEYSIKSSKSDGSLSGMLTYTTN